MLTRSHRLCSIAIVELGMLMTNSLQFGLLQNAVIIGATAIGASLPDIDEYNSSTSRKSVINFSLFLRHRGITHSLLGWVAFSTGLYFLMNYFSAIKLQWPIMQPSYWECIWLGLVIGYFLHLIEDSFSKQGVQWFAPFSRKSSHHFINYKVGGIIEKLSVFIAIIGICVMTVYLIYLFLKIPALSV